MLDEDEFDGGYLAHYGIARKSGRYPWGSGGDPYQRSRSFKSYMEDMKAKGLTETQIAEGLTEYANRGITDPKQHIKIKTTDLRGATATATEHIFAANQAQAYRLKEKNMSNVAIAKQMGTNESTVRGWLKQSQDIKEGSLRATANALKEQVAQKPFLDVGKGTELYMSVAPSKLSSAIAMLKDEGYKVHYMDSPQLGTDKQTKRKILTTGDKEWADAYAALKAGDVHNVTAQSLDGGLSYKSDKTPPVSINSKKLEVRYSEDGGHHMDGVIELRRGVEALSLGAKRYAQVRIAVDGTHYLKGMAMYADDLPAGVDMRFNTNKSKTDKNVVAKGKLGALKEMKVDPKTGQVDINNPFGATTKPRLYTDKNGKDQKSPLNLVNEEGSWDGWSRSLSSQMLSKQPLTLASKQLGETQKRRREEFNDIMKMTNPVVRQKLLDEFADSADAAAVHLKAAALPDQSSHVILPINSMRPHEIYAPNFTNGTKVALVRYPHGGPFEIPELVVNNKNPQAKRILGGARDAVGIHHSVAAQLSGADFDGDSVLVIPNNTGKVKARPPLKQLEGFEPKEAYPEAKGMTYMTKKNTQTEMGKISNLITDMTIHKATDDEIARAVKHSMVVIDAEKHKLNYKLSEEQNGIKALKERYQGGPRAGARTLISRASATQRIDKRIPRPTVKGDPNSGPIDPKTGKKMFVPDPKAQYEKTVTKVNKRTGEVVETVVVKTRQTKGTKMEFADDAGRLTSAYDSKGRKVGNSTPMEELYAAHANTMKDLANQARKASYDLAKNMPRQNKAAKAIYAKEVASLEAKLAVAQRNAPLERRAQDIGNALAKDRIDANPNLDKDDIKKIRFQSLEEGRNITGAAKKKIGAPDPQTGKSTLTEREWEAIQSGAFSSSRLKEILSNADMDRVKTLATPRARTSLTPGQLARARTMMNSGRPVSEIAEALGLPRSTVVDNLNR